MTAIFFDMDDDDNPVNGTTLASNAEVRSILESMHGRRPFMFQLQLEDGCKLDVGLADKIGCVQHTPRDGMPPYRMATYSASPPLGQTDREFSVGGTATPIDSRYCIPLHVVQMVIENLMEGRELPDGVAWEEI